MGLILSSAISTELATRRVRPAGWTYAAAHLPWRFKSYDAEITERALGVLRWALARPVGISRRRRGGAKTGERKAKSA